MLQAGTDAMQEIMRSEDGDSKLEIRNSGMEIRNWKLENRKWRSAELFFSEKNYSAVRVFWGSCAALHRAFALTKI
jgi:hypothetical protein